MNGDQDDPGIWSLGTVRVIGVLLVHLVTILIFVIFFFVAAARYLARDWKSFVGRALVAGGAWGVMWIRQRFRHSGP